MWIPGILIAGLWLVFLAIQHFSPPTAAVHRRFIRLVNALLAGFASLFLAGAAFVQAADHVSNVFKLIFTAASGVVVFGVCYLYPPAFLFGRTSGRDRP